MDTLKPEIEHIIVRAEKEGITFLVSNGKLTMKVLQRKEVPEDLLQLIKDYKEEIRFFLLDAGEKEGIVRQGTTILSANKRGGANSPLSFQQEQLWFIDRLQGSLSYHVPLVCRLNGSLNKEALTYAFQTIVERHHVLHAVIREDEGTGYQVVLPEKKTDLRYLKLEEIAGKGMSLAEFLDKLFNAPFNLSEDAMYRSALIRLSPDEHMLVMVFHHIAFDGWSLSVLLNELTELYTSSNEKRRPILKALPVQYPDYADWQRCLLKSGEINTKISYWKQHLSSLVPLDLFTDYARPSIMSNRGGVVRLSIADGIKERLEKFAGEERVTLFMLLMAAFKVLLYRYSGQTDLCIGSPVAGRQLPELEYLIGFFANTLALRSQINGTDSFSNFLQQTKKMVLEAYDHQEVPFSTVVEMLEPDRDLSRNPLFQVMFSTEIASRPKEISFGNVSMTWQQVNENNAKFDLHLMVVIEEEALDLRLVYCKDLYREETANRMLTHFENLITDILANRQTTIDQLNILTAAEIQRQLALNNTGICYPKNETITRLFEKQVCSTPESIALVYPGGTLTYEELDLRSNQLAHFLIEKGVKPAMLVPVCFFRSPEMITGLLAVLKAGACYVPVDPGFPQQRVQHILDECAGTVILSHSRCQEKLAATEQQRPIFIDDLSDEIAAMPVHAVISATTSAHLAYVLYTSGSTGNPKGVMVEHRSVVNYIQHQTSFFKIDSTDRILQFSTFTFDAFAEQVFLALLNGARLYLITREIQLDPEALQQFIRQHGITHLHATPGYLKNLRPDGSYPELRRVVSGGEECNVHLAKLWINQCQFYNKYGPTETTISSLIYHYNGHWTGENLPLGKPVSNTTVYILDRNGHLLPEGVPGELYIGGDGLARGYLHLHELTLEKFVPDTVTGVSGNRLYKTGDLVKMLPDGNILFLGRIDEQVKINGYRIEPGEVKNALESLSAVNQAAVLAIPDNSGGKKLVAYIVPAIPFERTQLIADLKEKLPAYMIPAVIMPIEHIPLTSNGKLNVKELPDVAEDLFGVDTSIAPRTAIEYQIAEIWKQLLGIPAAGIKDNFFERGGHSLKVIQLSTLLYKQFNTKIPIGHIYANPTIEKIAQLLEKAVIDNGIRRLEDAPYYNISHAQQRIWLQCQFENGNSAFNIPAASTITGDLNIAVLSEAFRKVIIRHENLRTVFVMIEDEPKQQILSSDGLIFSIAYRDLRGNPKAGEVLAEKLEAEAVFVFDLEKGPLLHASLFQVADDQHVLIFNIHHIISDGWSRDILIKEVLQLYDDGCKGGENSLSPLPVQYKDYAAWHAGQCVAHQFYWKNLYRNGIPVLKFPSDYPRPDTLSFSGTVLQRSLSSSLCAELEVLAAKHHTTLANLLLGIYGLLLAAYTRQENMVVGYLAAGRHHPDIEHLIGVFINFLPVLLSPKEDMNLPDYLLQTHHACVDAFCHQDYPFNLMVEDMAVRRDIARNPFFDTMINFHWESDWLKTDQFPTPEISAANIVLTPYNLVESNTANAGLDFKIDIIPTGDSLDVKLTYNNRLFKERRMVQLLSNFTGLLEQVSRCPENGIREYINWLNQQDPDLITNHPSNDNKMLTVQLCASFVIEPVNEYLDFWSHEMELHLNILPILYNQVFQQLLDPSSSFNKNKQINYLFIRPEDWLRERAHLPAKEQQSIIEQTFGELKTAIKVSRSFSNAVFFVGVVSLSPTHGFDPAIVTDINERIKNLKSFLESMPAVYSIDLYQIALLYSVTEIFDGISDRTGHMPFTPEYYAALGTYLSRMSYAWKNPPRKIIALDCDNTLWKGICGEVGPQGIIIDQHYSALQAFFLEKYHQGFLLVLCSKNNAEDVWEIFDHHPDMLLKREHISASRINWETKSYNLSLMAKELNVGIDSFVFVDDSGFEIAEMSARFPEVMALQLPEDTEEFDVFLKHVWAFDRIAVTEDDRNRNNMYKSERLRKEEEIRYTSLDDFLGSLNIHTHIYSLRQNDMERAVQLTQRTNQFNLNGISRSITEISNYGEKPGILCQGIAVKDRFGDYGMVGVLLAKEKDNRLLLESFMLSCRVLGRKVEEEILSGLKKYCRERKLSAIEAQFRVTKKNQPFQEFLIRTGWSPLPGSGNYVLSIELF